MLNWAVTFLIIAIIAAILGFGGVAGVATEIAKILFFATCIARLFHNQNFFLKRCLASGSRSKSSTSIPLTVVFSSTTDP